MAGDSGSWPGAVLRASLDDSFFAHTAHGAPALCPPHAHELTRAMGEVFSTLRARGWIPSPPLPLFLASCSSRLSGLFMKAVNDREIVGNEWASLDSTTVFQVWRSWNACLRFPDDGRAVFGRILSQRTLFRSHLRQSSLTAGNIAATIEVHHISALASEVDRAPNQAFLRQRGHDDFPRQRNKPQFRPAKPRRIWLSARDGAGKAPPRKGRARSTMSVFSGSMVLTFGGAWERSAICLAGEVFQLRLAAPQKPIIIHDALAKFLNIIGRRARW